MGKIIVSGFKPFNNETINPSFLAVSNLNNIISNKEIIKIELETSYQVAFEKLEEMINYYQPELVIAVGQAGGRRAISIERYGMNWLDFKIPDNNGNLIKHQLIHELAPLSFQSTLPINLLLNKLKDENIPVEISNRAGGFICKEVMFRLLKLASNNSNKFLAGFIHVPYELSQLNNKKNQFGMELSEISRGLNLIIEETIKYISSNKLAEKI